MLNFISQFPGAILRPLIYDWTQNLSLSLSYDLKKWFLCLCPTPSRGPTTCREYGRSILRIQRWIRCSPNYFFFLRGSVSWVILVIINLSLLSSDCGPYKQPTPLPPTLAATKFSFPALFLVRISLPLLVFSTTPCRCSGPCQGMVNLAWVWGCGWIPHLLCPASQKIEETISYRCLSLKISVLSHWGWVFWPVHEDCKDGFLWERNLIGD